MNLEERGEKSIVRLVFWKHPKLPMGLGKDEILTSWKALVPGNGCPMFWSSWHAMDSQPSVVTDSLIKVSPACSAADLFSLPWCQPSFMVRRNG